MMSLRKISDLDLGLSIYLQDEHHYLLKASVPFQQGQIMSPFYARETLSEPTYQSVQTGAKQHIHIGPECFQYLNHSCAPNVHIDIAQAAIICLRDIAIGEEICFFYPSTELDMHQPFTCHCGSPQCLGTIRGAKYLAKEILSRYVLNEHVK